MTGKKATQPDKLNTFYNHFDLLNKESVINSTLPPKDQPLSVGTADERKMLLSVNMTKAAGPDNFPGPGKNMCQSAS